MRYCYRGMWTGILYFRGWWFYLEMIPFGLKCMNSNLFDLIWFGLVLWHINHCRLFNTESIFIHLNSSIHKKKQFSISSQFNSIWPIDRKLSGATTPSQCGLGTDRNEEVLRIPQSSRITGASPDCLMSCPGHMLGESYPSTEMKSVYSKTPADWAMFYLSSHRGQCHLLPAPYYRVGNLLGQMYLQEVLDHQRSLHPWCFLLGTIFASCLFLVWNNSFSLDLLSFVVHNLCRL